MWKSIVSAFLLVFLAELGDKTQLSTMLLASKSSSIWYIFAGASCALILSSLFGVLAGSVFHKYIPSSFIRYGSGAVFIVIGILLISGKL